MITNNGPGTLISLKENVTFRDILLHSPYENLLNCGLSESDFWSHLFVCSNEYKQTADKIFHFLTPGDNSRSFMFLKAFSGCGKTTFARWLIKVAISETTIVSESDIYRQYLNLSFNTTIQESEKNSAGINQSNLSQIIKQTIKENISDYQTTFRFLSENFETLEPKLEGLELKRDSLADLINQESVSDLRRAFSTFASALPITTLMVVCLLQKIIFSRELGKKICFFCLDNLDSLNYPYLVKGFWSDFLYSYNRLAEIVRETMDPGIDVKRRLKFLFIVREHHYYVIKVNLNPHQYAVITNSFAVISLPEPNLRKILTKRVKLAQMLNLNIESRIFALVSLIRNEDSIYTEKFYLPLFNYDLRKLHQKIVEIIIDAESVQFSFDFRKYRKLYNYKVFNEAEERYEYPYRNGARGILIHSFLKILFQSDEKYPIEPIFNDPPAFPREHPFCSHCRLLLTVIYNLTCRDGDRLDRNLDDIQRIGTKDFSLDELINQLRICEREPERSIIPIDNVFSWLRHFYTIGNETITHLINISGKASRSNKKMSFEKEMQMSKTVKTAELYDTELSNIRLRINPSGIVYLRYLIPHFEFFSCFKYWNNSRFTKEFKPLYLSTGVIRSAKGQGKFEYRYEFEVLIEDVFEIVERKKSQNESFLREKIFRESRLPNLPAYLRSNFVVHFKDTADILYSSRLITTHLTYLDQFRRFITEDPDFYRQIPDNRKNFQTKTNEEIKSFILGIQKKYVDLYFERQGEKTFDGAIWELMKDWRNHIDNLMNGRPSDFHSLDYQRSSYSQLSLP